MANGLTGEFDVVAEFSIPAVNRLLAAMHVRSTSHMSRCRNGPGMQNPLRFQFFPASCKFDVVQVQFLLKF
jgi:hypothetical protein